ncbi:immunoglobulin superfamily member 5 [Xyrichtys novacula]|nr:immunoglobulin superfamily member 5 [Xyrichtys novacula]
MTVSWKMSWLFCIFSLLYTIGAGPDQFQLRPLNTNALQGSDVSFNASVQGSWQIMTWMVRDLLVLTIPFSGDITSISKRFTARFCSGDPSCVEFTIRNVSRGEAGSVVCTVQGEFGSKTATLIVQESGTVNITEGDVKVNQDEQVEFRCVMAAWFPTPNVSWALNGQTVDTKLWNTTHMDNGDYVNSTSVLKFQAVRNTTVECQATVETLTKPQTSSVFLVVVPKPPDWTVLIAMVVSIGGFALLVLLIIGIIFCYKRRKEKKSSYQDEMRRVRTQSQLSAVTAAGRGQVNAGYVKDGQTRVAGSDITDSGFSQANGSSYFEMPDVIKHRHVTIV